jgi:hypothetical protein
MMLLNKDKIAQGTIIDQETCYYLHKLRFLRSNRSKLKKVIGEANTF